MAGLTPNAFVDMNTVIEIDKIGKVVNAYPFYGAAGAIAFTNGFKKRAFGPNLRMAGHTGFNRRNIGKSRFFNRSVTISTIDTYTRNMMLVAERNWLFLSDLYIGRVF